MEPEIKYMKAALREAGKAEKLEEVPIGCVIVQNDKIIARGYNRRNTDKNTLSHAYWHRGYAREALAFGIQLMFEEFHLHRIEAAVMPENTASIRLLESLGFQQEGVAREYALIQGKWEDHIRFALIRPSGDTSSQKSPLTAGTAFPSGTVENQK